MAVLGASLAGMLGRVARLRLGEIAVRILHEVRLGLLIAEAISPLNGRIDGAIRFDVLMQSEALRTYCRIRRAWRQTLPRLSQAAKPAKRRRQRSY